MCLQANKESTDSSLENCCGLTELICAVRWERPHQAWDVRATRTRETSHQSCDTFVETLNRDSAADDTQSGSCELTSCGLSVDVWRLDWAGDAPITASSRERSTIALSSGEAELVAALSGACEGLSLRQQWNWLLKFGCNAEETSETTQQIPCCDSSAAPGMIKRKGSTRKTRHIELKAFFLQQWSARAEVRLVQVALICHNCVFVLFFRIFLPVLCGTHHTVHNELEVDVCIHSVFVCAHAILVTRCMSVCGQTPAVPDPD